MILAETGEQLSLIFTKAGSLLKRRERKSASRFFDCLCITVPIQTLSSEVNRIAVKLPKALS